MSARGLKRFNTVNRDRIVIRPCETMLEMQACAKLEKRVWGFPDADVEPVRSYIVATHIGGQVIGAFFKRQLIGFVMALPGVRNGRPYLYSRALAVDKGFRNAGLGRRLKLFQREVALAKGIDLIEWTFDPLETKNAFLNLERLGAISRRYLRNQYGTMTSRLQGGLPSDRLVAEWWLRAPGVVSVLNSEARAPMVPAATVVIPAEIHAWKASSKSRLRARKAQMNIRKKFLEAFSRGLIAGGLERDEKGNGAYLFFSSDQVLGERCESALKD